MDATSPFKLENGDQDNTTSEVVSEVVKAEENRAEEHDKLQVYIKKAMDAMKNLEDSYKFLYEQITQAKRLFAENDPTHKALDDILTHAAKANPESILQQDGVALEQEPSTAAPV